MGNLGHSWKKPGARRRSGAGVSGGPPEAHTQSPAHEPEASRLQRLALWCTRGRLAEAELELYEWCGQADSPLGALRLLVALFVRRGQFDLALSSLARFPEDRGIQRLERIVRTVAAQGGSSPQRSNEAVNESAIADWLEISVPPGSESPEPATPLLVEQLAAELLKRQDVIPSLVAAANLNPRAIDTQLLRMALYRVVAQIDSDAQFLVLCQAQAELAIAVGDDDDARRWAHRGLKVQPFYAQLALLLGKLPDDTASWPPAHEVLSRAADANPEYPDLQAALIRRQNADGHGEAARARLHHWLGREPQNPIARRLERELAA